MTASCCKSTANHGTYAGVNGPVVFCKKCGRAGKSVTGATDK